MISKSLIIGIGVGVVFFGGIIWDTFRKRGQVSEIKTNLMQTKCIIIGRSVPKKSSDNYYGTFIQYEFQVEGKTYSWSRKYFFDKEDNTYLKGETFPVVYSLKNPEKSRILILQRDFEEFGLTQPEELKKYNGIVK